MHAKASEKILTFSNFCCKIWFLLIFWFLLLIYCLLVGVFLVGMQVIEFVQFKERLQRSSQYLVAKIEAPILQLKQNAYSIQEEEVIFVSLPALALDSHFCS